MLRKHRRFAAALIVALILSACGEDALEDPIVAVASSGATGAAGADTIVEHGTRGELPRPLVARRMPQTPIKVPVVRLERISVGAAWPREVYVVGDELQVRASARPHFAGEVAVPDAGSDRLFRVDPMTFEELHPGTSPSARVRSNARLIEVGSAAALEFAALDGRSHGCGDFEYQVDAESDVVLRKGAHGSPTAARPGRVSLGRRLDIDTPLGRLRHFEVAGYSAIRVRESWLYVALARSGLVLRFALDGSGDLRQPVVGQLLAEFQPAEKDGKGGAELADLAFDPEGRLHVAGAAGGRIWNIGRPDPERVFSGFEAEGGVSPWCDLSRLTADDSARLSGIAFDDDGRLLVCASLDDAGGFARGQLLRVDDEIRLP